MRKQPETKTEIQSHWGKRSPLATPTATATAMAMQWVMTKQQPTGIQTVVTTPPPTRHHCRATHPNATQGRPRATLMPPPGEHSAPAKPPEMHWALLASSLVPALRPHSVKRMRSATLM